MDDIFERLSPTAKKNAEDFNGQFEPVLGFDQFLTPEIPANLLPPSLANYVLNISEMLSIPLAMPFMAALGVVSASISKKFVVSPKPDWNEPVNIYSVTAMLPANNKSLTLKHLKAPLDEWEKRMISKIAPDREKSMSELKLIKMHINKHSSIIKAKKTKEDDTKKASEAILNLEKELLEKEKSIPVLPRVYTTDATPEAIAELVNEQDGRLGIISDEGGITEVISGLYNNGNANIDIFLKGIDGGTTRIKRANRDYTLNPFLTVILLIQPKVLSNMAEKKAFAGNGALERFLYTFPVGNIGSRTLSDISIHKLYQATYTNLIIELLDMPTPESPYILKLEDPAQKLFIDFWHEIERELKPDGKLRPCLAWGGKLAGYTLRLAGLMHVAEHASTTHLTIQKATMEKAISLARLLISHTIATFGLMGADTELTDAQDLYDWLKSQHKTRYTKTEIIDAMHSRHIGKKGRLDKALSVLIQRNIISDLYCDKSTKKPTNVYFVNPEIFK